MWGSRPSNRLQQSSGCLSGSLGAPVKATAFRLYEEINDDNTEIIEELGTLSLCLN
jgi:hypothetical protein